MDILSATGDINLTPKTMYPCLIIFVDAFSWFSCIMGLHDKRSGAVAVTMKQFTSKYGLVDTSGFLDIDKVKAGVGLQFTLVEFKDYC